MANPLVSVVIPCFNQAHFLPDAIESCLRQTLSDLEVIVVDDGSTDETVTVATAAAARDSRVRLITTENRGVGAARNRGLSEARGVFVNLLDADDLLHPGKLSAQSATLHANPDIDVVLCDIDTIDADGRVIPAAPRVHLERLSDPDGWFDALLAGGLFPPHVPLTRRTRIEAVGGCSEDRAVAGHADYLLWLRLAATGARLHVLDTPLASYRRTSGSMSTDDAHMTSSRRLVFAALATLHPDRLALGLDRLCGLVTDLRVANACLAELARTANAPVAPTPSDAPQRLAFLERLLAQSTGPIFVWGTGEKGRQTAETLRAIPRVVSGFIDSNPNKWGQVFEDVLVFSPDDQALQEASLIVIASIHHPEIASALDARGLTRYIVAP